MTTTTITVPLVAAIEEAWAAIQERHEDVPEVVVTLASGNGRGGMAYGHFAASRWARGDALVHELLVGGEGLQRGGRAVLGTLIHKAAHAAAEARGIKDTSRQGRFHNTRFKAIGEEFGLILTKDPSIGWSITDVPDATAHSYRHAIDALDAAIVAYRLTDIGAVSKKTNNGVVAMCECGRKLRVSRSTFEVGPIVCGVCNAEFEPKEDDEG